MLALHSENDILSYHKEGSRILWPNGLKETISPAEDGASDSTGTYFLSTVVKVDPKTTYANRVRTDKKLEAGVPTFTEVYEAVPAPTPVEVRNHVFLLVNGAISLDKLVRLLLYRELGLVTPAMTSMLVEFKSWFNQLEAKGRQLFKEGDVTYQDDSHWPTPPVSLKALRELL